MRVRVVKPPQNAWDRLCQESGEFVFSARDRDLRSSHGGRGLALLGGNSRYMKGSRGR